MVLRPFTRSLPRIQTNALVFGARWYSPRAMRRRANLAEEAFLLPEALSSIVDESVVVIERQLEIGSVVLGFEQGRIFRMYRPDGTPLGHMEEVDLRIGRAIMRQITRLHRPFTVRVFDVRGNHALTIRRPFSFINSHIRCILPTEDLVGESQQEWHLWRRRYNLYLASAAQKLDSPVYTNHDNTNEEEFKQFGRIDAPFLSFQFPVQNEQNAVIGSIDRNWTGIGREIFTDTGVYFLRFSPERVAESLISPLPVSQQPLSLAERVIMLGTAVSVDFDYFSRHSNRGPMMFPFFTDDV